MRVLWFTSLQLPAVTGKGLMRGGWQESMRRALELYHPEIELGIASYGDKNYEPFKQGNATYFNIYRAPRAGRPLQLAWNNLAALIDYRKHFQYSPAEMQRFVEITRAFHPDAIMIYGTENPFGLMCAEYGAPSVLVIQAFIGGFVENQFAALSWPEFLKIAINRRLLRGTGVFHRWLSLKGYVALENAITRNVQYFSGRTAWDKAWLMRINPQAQYFHCDEIIAPAFYENHWQADAPRDKIIYTTSSDALIKGAVTLVRAFAELKRRGRTDISLRMAGTRPDGDSGPLIQKIIQQNKLGDQVQLLGRVPPQQIITEMQAARLFVLPSHFDNSPNSLCEAMLMGMPCVSSDAGGNASMLADGREGLLYPHKNIPALADRIEWMLDHPAEAAAFGRAARATALIRHDPKRVADRMVEIYQTIMSA